MFYSLVAQGFIIEFLTACCPGVSWPQSVWFYPKIFNNFCADLHVPPLAEYYGWHWSNYMDCSSRFQKGFRYIQLPCSGGQAFEPEYQAKHLRVKLSNNCFSLKVDPRISRSVYLREPVLVPGLFLVMINDLEVSNNRPFATSDHVVQNPPCWRPSSLLFPH